jgi:hypothetical protein
MTYQPGEQPYAPPQDPWAGDQGQAAAPTDPIPQPVRGQFTPGVASPSVWAQETVAHSDPYPSDGGGGGGRTGLYLLVVLLVVVLGGAGGFGAWWAITNYASNRGTSAASPTATDDPNTPSPSSTEMRVSTATFDLLAVGDCLINRGTPEAPEMFRVPCDWPGDLEVVQIIRKQSGPGLQENEAGRFDLDTARAVCGDLPRFNMYYANNHPNNDDFDFLLCLSRDIRVS